MNMNGESNTPFSGDTNRIRYCKLNEWCLQLICTVIPDPLGDLLHPCIVTKTMPNPKSSKFYVVDSGRQMVTIDFARAQNSKSRVTLYLPLWCDLSVYQLGV